MSSDKDLSIPASSHFTAIQMNRLKFFFEQQGENVNKIFKNTLTTSGVMVLFIVFNGLSKEVRDKIAKYDYVFLKNALMPRSFDNILLKKYRKLCMSGEYILKCKYCDFICFMSYTLEHMAFVHDRHFGFGLKTTATKEIYPPPRKYETSSTVSHCIFQTPNSGGRHLFRDHFARLTNYRYKQLDVLFNNDENPLSNCYNTYFQYLAGNGKLYTLDTCLHDIQLLDDLSFCPCVKKSIMFYQKFHNELFEILNSVNLTNWREGRFEAVGYIRPQKLDTPADDDVSASQVVRYQKLRKHTRKSNIFSKFEELIVNVYFDFFVKETFENIIVQPATEIYDLCGDSDDECPQTSSKQTALTLKQNAAESRSRSFNETSSNTNDCPLLDIIHKFESYESSSNDSYSVVSCNRKLSNSIDVSENSDFTNIQQKHINKNSDNHENTIASIEPLLYTTDEAIQHRPEISDQEKRLCLKRRASLENTNPPTKMTKIIQKFNQESNLRTCTYSEEEFAKNSEENVHLIVADVDEHLLDYSDTTCNEELVLKESTDTLSTNYSTKSAELTTADANTLETTSTSLNTVDTIIYGSKHNNNSDNLQCTPLRPNSYQYEENQLLQINKQSDRITNQSYNSPKSKSTQHTKLRRTSTTPQISSTTPQRSSTSPQRSSTTPQIESVIRNTEYHLSNLLRNLNRNSIHPEAYSKCTSKRVTPNINNSKTFSFEELLRSAKALTHSLNPPFKISEVTTDQSLQTICNQNDNNGSIVKNDTSSRKSEGLPKQTNVQSDEESKRQPKEQADKQLTSTPEKQAGCIIVQPATEIYDLCGDSDDEFPQTSPKQTTLTLKQNAAESRSRSFNQTSSNIMDIIHKYERNALIASRNETALFLKQFGCQSRSRSRSFTRTSPDIADIEKFHIRNIIKNSFEYNESSSNVSDPVIFLKGELSNSSDVSENSYFTNIQQKHINQNSDNHENTNDSIEALSDTTDVAIRRRPEISDQQKRLCLKRHASQENTNPPTKMTKINQKFNQESNLRTCTYSEEVFAKNSEENVYLIVDDDEHLLDYSDTICNEELILKESTDTLTTNCSIKSAEVTAADPNKLETTTASLEVFADNSEECVYVIVDDDEDLLDYSDTICNEELVLKESTDTLTTNCSMKSAELPAAESTTASLNTVDTNIYDSKHNNESDNLQCTPVRPNSCQNEENQQFQINKQSDRITNQSYNRTTLRRSSTTPQRSSTTPQRSSTTPQRSSTTPQRSSTTPQRSSITPQRSSTAPRRSSKTPQRSSTAPQRSSKTPQRSSTAPRRSSSTPQRSSTTPQRSSKTPQKSSTAPRRSSKTPQRSSTTPRRLSTAPRISSTTPQRSSTPPRRSSTTPQRSSTTPQRSSTTRQRSSTAPERSSTTPERSSTAPRRSSTTRQRSSTTPQRSSTTPQRSSTTPQRSSTTPQRSSTTRQRSSTAPRRSSTTPQRRSLIKHNTPLTRRSRKRIQSLNPLFKISEVTTDQSIQTISNQNDNKNDNNGSIVKNDTSFRKSEDLPRQTNLQSDEESKRQPEEQAGKQLMTTPEKQTDEPLNLTKFHANKQIQNDKNILTHVNKDVCLNKSKDEIIGIKSLITESRNEYEKNNYAGNNKTEGNNNHTSNNESRNRNSIEKNINNGKNSTTRKTNLTDTGCNTTNIYPIEEEDDDEHSLDYSDAICNKELVLKEFRDRLIANYSTIYAQLTTADANTFDSDNLQSTPLRPNSCQNEENQQLQTKKQSDRITNQSYNSPKSKDTEHTTLQRSSTSPQISSTPPQISSITPQRSSTSPQRSSTTPQRSSTPPQRRCLIKNNAPLKKRLLSMDTEYNLSKLSKIVNRNSIHSEANSECTPKHVTPNINNNINNINNIIIQNVKPQEQNLKLFEECLNPSENIPLPIIQSVRSLNPLFEISEVTTDQSIQTICNQNDNNSSIVKNDTSSRKPEDLPKQTNVQSDEESKRQPEEQAEKQLMTTPEKQADEPLNLTKFHANKQIQNDKNILTHVNKDVCLNKSKDQIIGVKSLTTESRNEYEKNNYAGNNEKNINNEKNSTNRITNLTDTGCSTSNVGAINNNNSPSLYNLSGNNSVAKPRVINFEDLTHSFDVPLIRDTENSLTESNSSLHRQNSSPLLPLPLPQHKNNSINCDSANNANSNNDSDLTLLSQFLNDPILTSDTIRLDSEKSSCCDPLKDFYKIKEFLLHIHNIKTFCKKYQTKVHLKPINEQTILSLFNCSNEQNDIIFENDNNSIIDHNPSFPVPENSSVKDINFDNVDKNTNSINTDASTKAYCRNNTDCVNEIHYENAGNIDCESSDIERITSQPCQQVANSVAEESRNKTHIYRNVDCVTRNEDHFPIYEVISSCEEDDSDEDCRVMYEDRFDKYTNRNDIIRTKETHNEKIKTTIKKPVLSPTTTSSIILSQLPNTIQTDQTFAIPAIPQKPAIPQASVKIPLTSKPTSEINSNQYSQVQNATANVSSPKSNNGTTTNITNMIVPTVFEADCNTQENRSLLSDLKNFINNKDYIRSTDLNNFVHTLNTFITTNNKK